MSTTVEMIGSSSSLSAGNDAALTRRYAVTGATNEVDACESVRDYLFSTIGNPPNIGAVVLDFIRTTEQTAEGVFHCEADWKTFARKTPLSTRASGSSSDGDFGDFSFNLQLEPVKVVAPIGTPDVYKLATAKDWVPNGIGDTGNGELPPGVDIFEPIYEESRTIQMPLSELTTTYRRALMQCVGKTNSAPFKGWSAGEVLMRGISGTRRGEYDAELNFRWSVRENEDNITVGSITGISKTGWQFLWPRWEKKQPVTNGPFVNTATHVCVATVFKSVNFSQLNIGI